MSKLFLVGAILFLLPLLRGSKDNTTFSAGLPALIRRAGALVIGGGEKVYYTPDHYKTFVRLNIAR